MVWKMTCVNTRTVRNNGSGEYATYRRRGSLKMWYTWVSMCRTKVPAAIRSMVLKVSGEDIIRLRISDVPSRSYICYKRRAYFKEG